MIGDAYALLPSLKARLGITDVNDDAPLTEALNVASRACERYTRRQFNKDAAVAPRIYRPESAVVTFVDDFHTATGLIVKTDDDDDGTFETTWAATDYEVRPLNNVRDGTKGWPFFQIWATDTKDFPYARRATVQITADWGWNVVPPGVKEATLIGAEEIWKIKDAPFGVAGFGEFGSIRVRDNPKVVSLLQPYRRVAVRLG